jgi:hypothetical protein
MRTELIISEAEPRGDLRESIAQALTEDGEHVLYHDRGGRKLIAQVSNGAIVNWTAFDKDGSEVATVVVRQPERSPARWAIVCACFESGDFCWWQPY